MRENYGIVLKILVSKKLCVLNLFLSNTSVLIIINCFTLVFNGFNCKPYLKSKK